MFLEFGSEVHAALVAQIAEAEKEMLQMNDGSFFLTKVTLPRRYLWGFLVF